VSEPERAIARAVAPESIRRGDRGKMGRRMMMNRKSSDKTRQYMCVSVFDVRINQQKYDALTRDCDSLWWKLIRGKSYVRKTASSAKSVDRSID
jgi:hypothetical protein